MTPPPRNPTYADLPVASEALAVASQKAPSRAKEMVATITPPSLTRTSNSQKDGGTVRPLGVTMCAQKQRMHMLWGRGAQVLGCTAYNVGMPASSCLVAK